MKIDGKLITDKEILNKLISLDESSQDNKCTKETFIWLFGKFKGKNRCNTYDYIKIPPNSYGPEDKRNKNEFTTTVGRFFFNKLFIENSEIFNVIKYVNFPMNKKNIGNIVDKISYACLDDEISLEHAKDFFQKYQWLMSMIMIISNHESEETIDILNKITKKKNEYLKKYEKEISEKDENTMIMIENELTKYAEDICKDTEMYDIYASGMCSFGNHFKDIYVIKGMAKDPNPNNGYHFITGSYMEGMDKDSYYKLIRTQASGPYARGNLTQTGGEMEKQFVRAYQHIKTEKGTDCGTDRYITEVITNSNFSKYIYNYIIDNGKLVLLTYNNKDKYLNKECKIRFSSTCKRTKNGNICNVCMGELPNKLGDFTEIGLVTSIIGSSCKNAQMKAFHDGQVKSIEMDVQKAFGF